MVKCGREILTYKINLLLILIGDFNLPSINWGNGHSFQGDSPLQDMVKWGREGEGMPSSMCPTIERGVLSLMSCTKADTQQHPSTTRALRPADEMKMICGGKIK